MNEAWVLAGAALAAASGLPGLFCPGCPRWGERSALALLATGALAGLRGAVGALADPGAPGGWALPWAVPGAAFHVEVDPIAAFFLVPIFAIALAGAFYGLGYWPRAEHPREGRRLAAWYGLLVGAMALLAVARHGLLFLAAWETMAMAAFFAITTEDARPEVRQAGYVYLVSTRAGTLCLVALLAVLYVATGDLELRPLGEGAGPGAPWAIFLLALAGFGLKAGLLPLHLWLPGAHSGAPSHVSALLSGVFIKMGILGLVRFTALVPHPPLAWGLVVLAAGTTSAVLGVVFALGQHDLKRLLAYHSVENIGIIAMGLGVALCGRAAGRPGWVVLGMAGALLHVWNHALFKALLFLGAGAVLHAAGTREMDRLGGLLRRMPWTGGCFILGAAAISGLPPLNGFVSEVFVYLGLLGQVTSGDGRVWMAGALAAPALAMVGALAAACFAKACGTVFLGEPRTEAAARAHEVPWSMRLPMLALALACLAIGLAPALVAPVLDRAAAAWALVPPGALPPLAGQAPLGALSAAGLALVGLAAVLGGWLAWRSRGARRDLPTWDCGYAAPSPTMQYTASSFAATLVDLWAWVLRPEVHRTRPRGLFPARTAFRSHVPEVVLDLAALPAARGAVRLCLALHRFQGGSVHAYLLYIFLALLCLLAWPT